MKYQLIKDKTMIKTKKQLITAFKDAAEQWKDLAITATEMRKQIRSAKAQYQLWQKRNSPGTRKDNRS